MNKRLLVALVLLFALAVVPRAWAQGSGTFAGVSQCYNGHEFVTVHGNCPSTGSSSGSNTGSYSGLNQAGYQLGYALGNALGNWLRGPRSDPQAEAQKQAMLQEIARRQAEAERQHREEEARRLALMYNRLQSTLKLSGLPNLQLKDVGTGGSGLQLKLGPPADNRSPGFYLNENGKWVLRGISGLPGIYTDNGGQSSGSSGLQLKLGQGTSGPGAAPQPTAPPDAQPAAAAGPGLQIKMGDGNNAAAPSVATFDPSRMTPQQLADVADYISKLPPDQQQALLSGASAGQAPPPSTGMMGKLPSEAPTSLQQQATDSQAAANATGLEDASAKARVGFDQAGSAPPAQLGQTGTTPQLLRPQGTAISSTAEPPAPLPPPSPSMNDLRFLFPDPSPEASNTFPPQRVFQKNPNPPLLNPLREEQKVQAELRNWDNWAVQQAMHINDRPPDYPLSTEREMLNSDSIQRLAPELLPRYKSDPAFRRDVDVRLDATNQLAAFDYYQGLAEAHKQAVLAYQAELEKLAGAGRLDKLTPLEEQYRLHPERRQIVQDAWERVSAGENAAEEKARADGFAKLNQKYQWVFQLIRNDAAQPQ